MDVSVDIDFNLFPKQALAWKHLTVYPTQEIIYGGAAGGGKTWLGCFWIATSCMQYGGSRWFIGRLRLNILKRTTLLTLFQVLDSMQLKTGFDYKYREQASEIVFRNGSIIFLLELFDRPSDPEVAAIGGLEVTGGFVDEANQITGRIWNLLPSRIRYKVDHFDLSPTLLGACNPSQGYIFQQFYLPHKKGELPKEKAFIQSLASDNRFLDDTYHRVLDNLTGIDQKRLRDGLWEYDDNEARLMGFEAISDVFHNDGIKKGRRCITVDVARLGSDLTVIWSWEGMRAKLEDVVQKTKMNEVVDKIEKLRKKLGVYREDVVVDEDGVGGGVVDEGDYTGFVANRKPVPEEGGKTNYQNLKAQCVMHYAGKVENREVYIDLDKYEDYKDRIIREHAAQERHNIDKDGKIQVLPKEKQKQQLGYSPDFFDSLMMKMYNELMGGFFVK